MQALQNDIINMYHIMIFQPTVQWHTFNGSHLAKMKKSIPDMSLP